MRTTKKKNGGVKKVAIIIAKMPKSYLDFDAEPSIIKAGGLTITTQNSFKDNIVTSTYIYDAEKPTDMP